MERSPEPLLPLLHPRPVMRPVIVSVLCGAISGPSPAPHVTTTGWADPLKSPLPPLSLHMLLVSSAHGCPAEGRKRCTHTSTSTPHRTVRGSDPSSSPSSHVPIIWCVVSLPSCLVCCLLLDSMLLHHQAKHTHIYIYQANTPPPLTPSPHQLQPTHR